MTQTEISISAVEALKVFFETTHPMPDRVQYLELKRRGAHDIAIKKLMGITDARLQSVRRSVERWSARFEEHGAIALLKPKLLGTPREKGREVAHVKVSLKNELHSKRIEKYLTSQEIRCFPLKVDAELSTIEILVTDDLCQAVECRTFVILVSNCFENLPAIERLVGCIASPFSVEVVAAQIKVILKRIEPQIKEADRVLQFGGIELNQTYFCAYYKDLPIRLTAIQFRIVERLVIAKGCVVTYNDLAISAWRDDDNRRLNLTVQICNIRRKGIPIKLIHSIGYAIGSAEWLA